MKTRLTLSQTHLFKNVAIKTKKCIGSINKVNKNFDINNSIRTAFIFCFTTLENSTDIVFFNENLKNVKIISCRPTYKNVFEA
jgi:hypothetical protein